MIDDDPHIQTNNQQWWQMSSAEIADTLKTDPEEGLSRAEAQERLTKNGRNELTAKKKSNFIRFIKQFNNSIIYILAVAAIVTFLMHHYSDSIVIALVIIANAIIGYVQERQADDALAKISELLISKNFVIRGDEKLELDSRELVVGDLVNLEAGDAIPADLRLISADNFSVQESSLTGESVSVEKTDEPLTNGDLAITSQTNMAFASTLVTTGSALGIVTATAIDTEIGHIQQSVSEVKEQPTPLMRNLNKLGFGLSVAILIAAAILFIIGWLTQVYSLPILLIVIVTMVVGSMPEGLPASTSVVLAMGTQQMTKKNVIVKTLPAVETLGAVDIVNTDKTGTLTKNEMTVTVATTADRVYEISGVGYDAEGNLDLDGQLQYNGKTVDWHSDDNMRWLINIAGQTTDAQLHHEDGVWEITGEPTDGALTTLFKKLTGEYPDSEPIDSLPFDSAIRYSARLVDFEGQRVLMLKGSPATIINMAVENGMPIDEQYWEDQMAKMTAQGLRVVALAYQPVATDIEDIDPISIGQDMIIAGMVGMIDPPREEVAQSIIQLRQAGIKVKMITGDHPDTAKAIAATLGLDERINAITGPEIDEMSPEQLQDHIDEYNVFARTTPKNKLQIVNAQRANGHVVSMTGDGVNDAPALKQADIGVAMGIKGTEVAKESANMVLANDKFTDIVAAVREGRHVFDNINKTIRFLLPTSFAEGLVVAFSILLGQEMPLYPTQLLWINMVSALTIQFAFIFEPPESGIMMRGPRSVKSGILSKMDIVEIVYVSVLISGLGIWAFDWVTGLGVPTVVASTMTLNIIIFGKIFYLFNIRNSYPVISKYFFQNKMAFYIIGVLILLQMGIIYLPFMHGIFHTTSVNFFFGWLIPIIAGVIVLVITEIIKLARIAYRKESGKKAEQFN
ncbi:cation-transporting ATPase [Paucilactobacillus hokkaidonensis JCM 18461]|uniref:Cation-transporting ATPase n=3 Tax=Paucilactobacillus hokkaidonensis TaxID=1193095 RepID=A0A0A1GSY1_9LACO|nr:HAD-IC family P-type ATPase [Paucilactobacillus hokkaidonensis]KRO09267.1 cation transport ATPase [Paucilactobacillus hokkaidonensis]BAP85402.1 cation-transporting ATPase [Paucilactobacillus hokkaidonensis JCM 18461]